MLVATRQSHLRLLGQSDAIRRIEKDIESAARCDAKVLITGETGVGKEVVARLIHGRSARAAASLVTLNCAGLPDSLLESELFGHVRGSFTDAWRDKPGLLEMAPNGTLFLDEVGEMSARMQVVLLRFLESGEIQRIGADRGHARVNVRLIAATNRDLQAQIASGGFREDLYFRLNVIRLAIPPLRERAGDIPLLVKYFVNLYCTEHKLAPIEVSAAAMDALVAYRWPGNIRELKNVVERVLLKSVGSTIRDLDWPADVTGIVSGPAGSIAARLELPSPSDELVSQMVKGGESFWSAIYPIFMSRDLTRADLRLIVQVGLAASKGNYRLLVALFNMAPEDHRGFLSFLRKHDCHVPSQPFGTPPARLRG